MENLPTEKTPFQRHALSRWVRRCEQRARPEANRPCARKPSSGPPSPDADRRFWSSRRGLEALPELAIHLYRVAPEARERRRPDLIRRKPGDRRDRRVGPHGKGA